MKLPREFLLASIVCGLCWSPICSADFGSSAAAQGASSSTASSSPTSTPAPTGAQPANAFGDSARELQEFRHALKEIKRNTQSLLDEYNRSNLRILEFGDFINQYLDNKPVPYEEQLYPYGMQNFGNTGVVQGPPLPPRKEWVKHYRETIQELASLAGNELTDVLKVAPKSNLVDRCNAVMDLLLKDAATLQVVTDGSDAKARQHSIAEIIDDCTELELFAKRLVRSHMLSGKNY